MIQFLLLSITAGILLTTCCCSCLCCWNIKSIVRWAVSLFRTGDQRFQGNGSTNTECFICLEAPNNQVVTICNHAYCAKCIAELINRSQTVSPCPACRSPMRSLFRNFEARTNEQKHFRDLIAAYNQRQQSTSSGLLESLTGFMPLLSFLPNIASFESLRYFINSPGALRLAGMALYTISPIDLLPEAILGPIGLVDDAAVVTFLVRTFTDMVNDYVRNGGANQRVDERTD